jgi:hypothetical protein
MLGENMDIQDIQDCESNIRRISELLSCNIFEPANQGHLLQSSAFIDLMICLRDLMHKTEKYVRKINFEDDVMKNEYVNDVSDAIKAVRDACCHIDSFKRNFDENKNRRSFMVAYGKCNLTKIGDLELKTDYEDDIAVFYGKNRLYFKRHIVRAFNEALELITPLIENEKKRLYT